MKVQIDLSEACNAPCDRCGWLDSRGGIAVEDDTQNRKVLCHRCVVALVRACLPDGRFVACETTAATMPVARAS